MLGKRRFDRHFLKICTLTPFSRFPDIFENLFADRFDGILEQFLADGSAFESETILEKGKIAASLSELVDQFVESGACGVIKTFEFDIPVRFRAEDTGFHRFHFTGPDPDFADLVHRLAQELEFETRFAEGLDPVVGFMKHTGCLHGIPDIVLAWHWLT